MKLHSLGTILLAGLAAGFAPGCFTAVKEAGSVVMGAKGIVVPTRAVAADREARPLGSYRRFELGKIVDDSGGNVPSEFWTLLPGKFEERLRKAKLPNEPGGKTLLIRGKIFHFEVSGIMGLALGDVEEVVARLELVDKSTGKVLGEANCVGRTTTRATRGVPRKAEGLAKAIVEWIDSRYPEEGRE